ncbi:hypothetical protein AcW2_000474 [Taiwanofungus camphoratus]|nr:hypothetical protein AcW2_000474 [Antrodia cinnamomea]
MTTNQWRMQLNNYVQSLKSPGAISWDTSRTGPKHAPTWEAIVYINDIEWGRGAGPNQNRDVLQDSRCDLSFVEIIVGFHGVL